LKSTGFKLGKIINYKHIIMTATLERREGAFHYGSASALGLQVLKTVYTSVGLVV
jgi:hypothetical protein